MPERDDLEWKYGYYATAEKNHRFLDALDRLLAERRDWRCLDLGCGPGYLARYVADKLCPDGYVVGVEPDREPLGRARERATANLAFVTAAGQRLPFSDGVFDWVISNSVLEHIPHALRPTVVREALRVTKPGGRCLICTPTTLQKFWTLRMVGFHDKHVYGIRVRAADVRSVKGALRHWREILTLPWLGAREAWDLLPSSWLRLLRAPNAAVEQISGVCLFANRNPFMRWARPIERRYGSAPILRRLGTSLLVVLRKKE